MQHALLTFSLPDIIDLGLRPMSIKVPCCLEYEQKCNKILFLTNVIFFCARVDYEMNVIKSQPCSSNWGDKSKLPLNQNIPEACNANHYWSTERLDVSIQTFSEGQIKFTLEGYSSLLAAFISYLSVMGYLSSVCSSAI